MDKRMAAAAGVGALCGFTMGYAMHRVVGPPSGTDSRGQLFGSAPMTTAVIAGLVAVGAVGLLGWGRARSSFVFGAGLAGLLVLTAVTALPAPEEWEQLPVAVGVALDLIAVPGVLLPPAQLWFFGGMIAAVALGYQLDNLAGPEKNHYRHFPYAPAIPTETWHALVAIALASTLLVGAWWCRGERVEDQLPDRTLMVGTGTVLAAGLAARLWGDSGHLPLVAIVLVVAAAIAGIRWLSAQQATAWVMLVLVAAMFGTGTGLDLEPTPGLLLAVVALAVGAVIGLRRRQPVLAAAVCAVAALCVMLAGITEYAGARWVAATALLFAVGLAGGSVLPTRAALLAGWTALPALASTATPVDRTTTTLLDNSGRSDTYTRSADIWADVTFDSHPTLIISSSSDFGWTATAGDAYHPRPSMILPGLLIAGACAAAAVWLDRRRVETEMPEDPSTRAS
ncbi:hypothetical protein IU510_24655 [Nocardia cyriacigeorgica]|uniref:hypothetical protein n=1 Tax=Nocardia cyriacigeorgica TaxID=135487 RepID=UPI001894F081|nr:hypothetical protein [Nocardia cyriacigeorgica]MBF6101234.1 hypothetical protein [Nocardia cyriacigeorgica]